MDRDKTPTDNSYPKSVVLKAYYEPVFSKPDIVFGSDDYVSDFASRLDAAAVMLDRGEIPVSTTVVRNDLYKNWKFLNPFAAADLSAKIVVLGSESFLQLLDNCW